MDRLRNLVLNAQTYDDNDSVVSSDFNWNDISIGNNTGMCDEFFGVKRSAANGMEEDLNTIKIQFEDTIENNENNSNIVNTPNSVCSLTQTSTSSDDGVLTKRGHPIRNLNDGSRPRQINTHATHSAVPHVYLAGQIYEQKKKLRMAELERKEREQRQFHAKKAPNFNSIHAADNAKRVNQEHKHTVPKTPKVIHNHRKNYERVQAKLLELEKARQPKPFVARFPEVLVQPPFIPHQARKPLTEPVPFNLHSEDRSRERQQYDEQYKLEVERREKEQEEKRRAEDEQIRKEIRKATNFKARPNPFTSGVSSSSSSDPLWNQ